MALTRLSPALVKANTGVTLEEELYRQEVGTDSLQDKQVSGRLDTLINSKEVGAVDLRKKKIVIPNGTFEAARWMRNRGVSSEDASVRNFEVKGNGSESTILTHSSGQGDHIYMDYIKSAKIGGFTLDNTGLGQGTQTSVTNNGQMWIRYAEGVHFDDIKFKGGDVLSFCLDNCKNIMATNLKVDYQFRYPVGISKSPLIVGDFSERCMFIGGYVKAVSEDGTIMYSGDLADNDQANDTKWAFINLEGLLYNQKVNANACMWQEGQQENSNAHFFGMNYYGNGIGHGVSEKATGTVIGATYREAQARAVWNRNQFISIGGHYINNKALNQSGAGSTQALGGINNDNAKYTASIGEVFSMNSKDYTDYTGATSSNIYNSTHFSASKLAAAIQTASSSTSKHLGIVNCQLSDNATFVGGGNSQLHVSIVASHIIGALGQFGHGNSITVMDVEGSTFVSSVQTGAMITQAGVGRINVTRSTITGYTTGIAGGSKPNLISFTSCTFRNCTFNDTDLKAVYVNCEFVNCTNAPNTKGLNFAADSILRPSSARCEVVIANPGGSYSLPSWVTEGRGCYGFKVGGRGQNKPACAGIIGKNASNQVGAVTMQYESQSGGITVSWPADGAITFTFSSAGTYYVKID